MMLIITHVAIVVAYKRTGVFPCVSRAFMEPVSRRHERDHIEMAAEAIGKVMLGGKQFISDVS